MARRKSKRSGLCHPVSVTYDPGRRGGGGVPALRNEWREPLRAQRDPLAEDSGRVRSNRDEHRSARKQTLAGPLHLHLRLAGLCAADAGRADRRRGVPDDHRNQRARARRAPEGPVQGPPTIGVASTAIIGAPPKGLTQFDANLPTGILPEGGPFTEAGAKTWHIVPGAAPQVGQGTAKVFTYTVEVEDGVDTTTFGGDDGFARMVSETLANPKSWTHNPQFAFTRIDGTSRGKPDFRVSLSSPMTVREGCGYDIQLEASCYNPAYTDGAAARVHQRGALGARRRAVPGRRRLLPAVPDQPRGRPRHRLSAARAVRGQRRAGAGDDAADVLDQQQRRGAIRPRDRQARRQDLPVQPLAIPDRLNPPRLSPARVGPPDRGFSRPRVCEQTR